MPKPPAESSMPFGLWAQKPKHYREMLRIAWDNRRHLGYAGRVFSNTVMCG
jgi:hypothetical protein